MTPQYMYLVTFPDGAKVKADTNIFAIVAPNLEQAIEKSLKYGDNGIVNTLPDKLNKDWSL